ncbi:CheR family methyltransferase [Rariglobus hedericola]|uniref:CheR-type methyltransferase domain-containing protein n=1 Tax=Rariglobus hedericola TaxID=2597822 RepID=A0A556QL90_9BACT|nr:CheR family methyltransferase [Rariglobus hedericola]TSJ77415.1 hypothetical protein FPL22_15100 [Rariglobus hedericola]
MKREAAADEVLHPLMAWMLERAGLEPAAYRPAAMQRRVSACLRQLRVSTPDSARELLERKPEMLPFALNTVLIGVSEFFRDRAAFDYLESEVLPQLLKTRGGLRVCSAGSSGGQELYSVAMLLAEAGVLEACALLGVDCRSDAIKRAAKGVYSAEDMAGIEPERCRRFFEIAGLRWMVQPVLKKQIQWEAADLLTFKADAPFDLILFRNVSIYLNEAHGTETWGRLCDQLTPGGFLITGKAEKPPATLPLVRVAHSIYRKNL